MVGKLSSGCGQKLKKKKKRSGVWLKIKKKKVRGEVQVGDATQKHSEYIDSIFSLETG